MAKLPEIASLWIGGQLSWLEQLCLKSFADAGHHITLYSYAPISNIPGGVHAGDAADIFPGDPLYRHARTGSPAIHADIWRLQLLKKTDKIWVDADIYCYRPFDFKSRYVFGWEKPGLVCNAVLGLPKTSKTLAGLMRFFKDEYAIGPWLNETMREELQAEKEAGNPVHMTEQNWGFTGPASVTYFLQETGEIKHAQPKEAFYPISFKERNHMIFSRFHPEESFTDATRGVHFWARRMKPRLEEKENNKPRRGSFMDKLLKKHGIDPGAAVIPAKTVNRHEKADDPAFRNMIGIEAFEGTASIDKISRKYLVETRFVKDCLRDVADKAGQSGLEERQVKERSVKKNKDINVMKDHPKQGGKPLHIDAASLDYSMFDKEDLLNLILQRSDVLFDIPKRGRLIQDWSNGSTESLDGVVEAKGMLIAERAVRLFSDEFEKLQPILDSIPNKSIADIGCGYGIFDLFMFRAYGSDLVLIDLEENDRRHFGFSDEGSAYSKLAVAVEFLKMNGVAKKSISKLNPAKDDVMSIEPVDIAVSFLACGFHFPIDVYLEFFESKVKPGGHLFLDLRRGSFGRQRKLLEKLGDLTVLEEAKKQVRVMVKKH